MQLSARLRDRSCRHFRSAAILFVLFQGTASGQEFGAPAADQPRFTVELIVFTYSDSASPGNEIFVPDRRPADEYWTADPDSAAEGNAEFVFGDETADVNSPDKAPADAAADTPVASPEITGGDDRLQEAPLRERIELRLLDPGAYTMDAIYNELVRLDAYDPIMRTAWTQTTLAQELSPAIHLRALGNPPPGLDGSVTLYQGRFVHLGLDLALDAYPRDPAEAGRAMGNAADDRRSATDRAIVYGDARVQGQDADVYDGDGWLRAGVRYHLSESRIMKSGDIRYYDHPRFGVLAKVTKVEDPAASDRVSPTSD
ncbi:MAG: CsiV family protein [Woeseiaceae bacterium]